MKESNDSCHQAITECDQPILEDMSAPFFWQFNTDWWESRLSRSEQISFWPASIRLLFNYELALERISPANSFNSYISFFSHIADETLSVDSLFFRKILLMVYWEYGWGFKTIHDHFHFVSPMQRNKTAGLPGHEIIQKFLYAYMY